MKRLWMLAMVGILPVYAQNAPKNGSGNEPSPAEFARLHALIKPQAAESPWREVPWLTSLREAREKAIADDKPLLIITAADGNPVSRT